MAQSISITGNGNAVTNIDGNVYGGIRTSVGGAAAVEAKTAKEVILFASASPAGTDSLRVAAEAREILAALRSAPEGGRFVFEQRTAVRPQDFSAALLFLKPRIVHFSGHGDDEGTLLFEDHAGDAHPVAPQALAKLFAAAAGGDLECVVLNACWSNEQAGHLAAEVPYVVAMRTEVGDAAAIAFSIGFYLALAAGLPVPSAFAAGRAQIALMNIPEDRTPVLHTRAPATAGV